eukprot:TRINITY_DN57500_c0_g1_i1.p1 TRINITY_DN57500_c0_g1~~TRINITY_DN57500_c0_g1_i1.p1  ORF type:complete len:506 (+),score=95.53 TRINITY_DN57500_c0_g1_i1:118-1635(+)
MAIADIDYREYFLPETVQELHEAFVHFDSSGDGSISISELSRMFKSLGKPVSKAQLQQVIKEVDVDGNGEVDFEELCLLEIKMSGARPRADLINYQDYLTDRQIHKLETAFVQYDRLNRGRIGLHFLRPIVDQLGPWGSKVAEDRKPSQELYDDVHAEVDPNGTEEIDFNQTCSAFAVLTKARKRVNYREYLPAEEIEEYRNLFDQVDKRRGGMISHHELDRLFKRIGLMLPKVQLKALFNDFDSGGSGGISFQDFCMMMLRIRALRKIRVINPQVCTCEKLWKEEGFNVKELQMSGFGLEDFKRLGIPLGPIYREGAYTALELRRAGYSAKELMKCGAPLSDLRSAGFSLTDLRLAGYSAASLEVINRSLKGSLSAGDLSVLPQRCPKSVRTKGIALSSAGFQLMLEKLPPGVSAGSAVGSGAWKLPPRQMTPMIREHTDWMPKFREPATAVTRDGDSLDCLVEEAAISKSSSMSRRIPNNSNGFLLDEQLHWRREAPKTDDKG